MKTAIVTGANGFVGQALVRELLSHGYQIYAIVRSGHHQNIPTDERIHIVSLELAHIGELPDILPAQPYDILFHMAWTGSAGAARGDTVLQLQNAQWSVDAVHTAKRLGCQRVICAGSITEYEAATAAYTPGARPGPGYIYGGGKVAAHIMCMAAAAQLGIDLIWPEITNAYGPGEHSPRLVNSTLQKCMRGEEPTFTAGTQNYDFVYIDDVARAFRLIGEYGQPFHEYLIGSSSARPLKEFLLEMQAGIAPGLAFRFGDIPFSGTSLPLSRFDCSHTEEDTGFRAEVSFSEGCRRTMEWLTREACKNEP